MRGVAVMPEAPQLDLADVDQALARLSARTAQCRKRGALEELPILAKIRDRLLDRRLVLTS